MQDWNDGPGGAWAGYGEVEPPSDTDLSIPDDAIRMSQSTVGSMDLCPARVGYSKTEGFVDAPSEAMSFGTAVHAAIEHDLLHRHEPEQEAWQPSDMERLWAEGMMERDGYNLYDLASAERIAKSAEEAAQAVTEWQQRVLPQLAVSQNALIEVRKHRQLGTLPDGREVWFSGTADVADEDVWLVTDWKTAGRGWDQSKADFTGQASAYTWLYGIDIHVYWVWDRRKRRWDAYHTERTPDQVESYMRHAWMRARQIGAGIFPATSVDSTFGKMKRGWWCSARYCGAWDVCTFKYLADDVYEAQEVDVSVGWK